MKIAISGLNNTDNPAPGLAVAKSLYKEHTLIGLSYDVNESGNYTDFFKAIYLMPYPSAGFEELRPRLQEIRQESGIEAIIPNLDAELPLYIKYKKEIEAMGIALILPSQKNFDLRNKDKLSSLAKKLGITTPLTYSVSSHSQLDAVLQKESFPLMIKGNYYKAYKVYDKTNAYKAFDTISKEWGFPILVQKVVQGEEINYVGVADGKGNLIAGIGIKKLTTTELGKIWSGITIQNDDLLSIAERFCSQTHWEGAFELECIADAETTHLIEINPRFPAWAYFATQIGINLPKALIALIQGQTPPKQLEYPINKMYVRYVEELVTDFSDLMTLLSRKKLS